eukprot:COSAG02_NODE_3405_length_6797_cov_2.630188_2_plen_52_part_00
MQLYRTCTDIPAAWIYTHLFNLVGGNGSVTGADEQCKSDWTTHFSSLRSVL